MAKSCNFEGCNNPVFGGGYCRNHQYKRDKKPKAIKKVSEKGKIKRAGKKALIEEDMKFYMQVWNSREHKCFETDVYLGEEPLMTFFHHVLPKRNYTQYRHEDWNIVLLHPDVHNQVEIFIDRCPRVRDLTKLLKERYG